MEEQSTPLTLHVGMARRDITPGMPVALAGYAGRVQPSLGIHDPIFCRALALQDGDDAPALLFSIDLLNFTPDQDREYRRRLAQALGVAPGRLMLHCVHPHSSPAPWGGGPGHENNADYLEAMLERLTEAGREALARIEPRRLAWGLARDDRWLYNRHQELDDGSYSLRYIDDRARVVSHGPIDDYLRAIVLEDDLGRPDGVVLLYTAHPVLLGAENRYVSGEYPEALLRHLAEAGGFEPDRLMFLNGPCGDTNPMHGTGRDFATVDRMGRDLAETAQRAIENRAPLQGVGLRVVNAPFSVSCEPEAPEKREWRGRSARNTLENLDRIDPRTLDTDDTSGEAVIEARRAAAQVVLRWLDRHERGDFPEREELDLTAFIAGELVVLAAPFELMLQVALDASERIGEPVLTLYSTNGCPGYLGDASVHDHARSYEIGQSYVYYGRPGPFAVDTASRLVDAWAEMALRGESAR